MHSCVIQRDEIVARDVGHFPSLAIILRNAPDENNNNRPQSTLVERDPLSPFYKPFERNTFFLLDHQI